jgi:hypothetical protein
MVDLTLANPEGAYLFLTLMTTIGIVLGSIIFIVAALPGARRPRYRNFDAMPRTGAFCGAGVALFLTFIAWNTAFGEFYRIEIRDGAARLHYHMPARTLVLSLESITGMRTAMTMDKTRAWRIDLETTDGVYHSTNMSRTQMEEVWKTLADFVKPLA